MKIPKVYDDIINNSIHLLIAGTTGSGKSTVIHGLISTLLFRNCQLAFIDLKQVEMIKYKDLKNCIAYADTAAAAMNLLNSLRKIMLSRYQTMKKKRITKYDGIPIYLIIDEYAELWIDTKKACIPLIQSILQLGRAAGIHCIIASQVVLAKILNTELKVNITSILALRTRSAQDSRNIIGCSGSEKLPLFGYGLFYCPKLYKPIKVELPLLDPETETAILKHWTR